MDKISTSAAYFSGDESGDFGSVVLSNGMATTVFGTIQALDKITRAFKSGFLQIHEFPELFRQINEFFPEGPPLELIIGVLHDEEEPVTVSDQLAYVNNN